MHFIKFGKLSDIIFSNNISVISSSIPGTSIVPMLAYLMMLQNHVDDDSFTFQSSDLIISVLPSSSLILSSDLLKSAVETLVNFSF